MPTVTGNIRDVGLSFMPGLALRLKFVASAPATGPSGMVTTNPKYVTPSTSDGSFSVSLVETGFYWQRAKPIHVDVFAVWLNPNDPAGTGFDNYLMSLEVPAAGGTIGDLSVISTGNDIVHTSAGGAANIYSGFHLNTTDGWLSIREDLY